MNSGSCSLKVMKKSDYSFVKQMKEHNRYRASAAKEAGVVRPLDYAIFQDHGYKGLYGGLSQVDIHRRKGLKKGQKILDHMGEHGVGRKFIPRHSNGR